MTVMLLIGAPTVQAKASKLVVSQNMDDITITEDPIDPGRSWIDEGVLHVRGMKVKQTLDGPGALSEILFIRNMNLDLTTGYGEAWGKWTMDFIMYENEVHQELIGSLKGNFVAKLTPMGVTAFIIGHGTDGDFEGMHYRVIDAPTGATMTFIDPHGRYF